MADEAGIEIIEKQKKHKNDPPTHDPQRRT